MKLRAFCELPAGLAAVSLRLHGGAHCRPPISRMGSKRGYAGVILDALGLRSGQGADAYLWAEADPDVRGLLRAYPDAAMLTRIAEIIRGWADEEPRALWERLRAERKARPPTGDDAVGGWVYLAGNAFRAGAPESGIFVNAAGSDDPDNNCRLSAAAAAACKNLANYAQIVASNRLINVAGPDLRNTGIGGTTFGGAEFATPPAEVAGAFDALAADRAAWSIEAGWAFRCGEPESGFNDGVATGKAWNPDAEATATATARLAEAAASANFAVSSTWSYEQGNVNTGFVGPGERRQDTTATATARLARGGWPPVAILATIPRAADVAAWLGTPGDLDGCVVYADPPYQGTTPYGHALSRDEVLAYARDFDALGAVVCISEAEPLAALGWEATEITGGRRGQTRTFSKQQREWLTMNRPPTHTVATQTRMFA